MLCDERVELLPQGGEACDALFGVLELCGSLSARVVAGMRRGARPTSLFSAASRTVAASVTRAAASQHELHSQQQQRQVAGDEGRQSLTGILPEPVRFSFGLLQLLDLAGILGELRLQSLDVLCVLERQLRPEGVHLYVSEREACQSCCRARRAASQSRVPPTFAAFKLSCLTARDAARCLCLPVDADVLFASLCASLSRSSWP